MPFGPGTVPARAITNAVPAAPRFVAVRRPKRAIFEGFFGFGAEELRDFFCGRRDEASSSSDASSSDAPSS